MAYVTEWARSLRVPPTLRRMVCNVTVFPLIFLHRSACCRCAVSNCCPGLTAVICVSPGFQNCNFKPELGFAQQYLIGQEASQLCAGRKSY
eukprot:322187-Pelagomonas_calceolata.AAC.1